MAVKDPETAAETRPHPKTGRPETREQREQRLLADTTRIDMRQVAAMIGLSYQRVRVRNFARKRWQDTVDTGLLLPRKGYDEQEREATPGEVAEARNGLRTALPTPVDRHGQTDVWEVRQIARWANQMKMVDEWYEPV